MKEKIKTLFKRKKKVDREGESTEQSISKSLKKIENKLRYRSIFIQGLVRGFGSALGATVIFGTVVFIFFQAVDTFPFIQNLLEYLGIYDLIENTLQESVNQNLD